MSIVNCTGGRQLLDDIKPFPLLPHTREDMCFLLHHRAKPDPFKNFKFQKFKKRLRKITKHGFELAERISKMILI